MSVMGVLIAPLLFGVIIGSTGPSIDTMKNAVVDHEGNILRLEDTNPLVVFSAHQAAIFSSIVTIGAMVGALLGGTIVGICGFKWAIAWTIPMFLSSWCMMWVCRNVWALYVARALTGIAVGVNSFAVPTYISDISPVSLRGILGACNQLCITIGILGVYLLGYLCRADGGFVFPKEQSESSTIAPAPAGSFCDWRKMAWINIIPTLILGFSLIFISESPRWLASHGDIDNAKKVLRSIRSADSVSIVVEEAALDKAFAELKSRYTFSDDGKKKRKTVHSGRQLAVGIALMVFQQFSGINSFMFYCTSILRDAKIDNADRVSVYVMIEQVAVTFLACILIDRVGRKILLAVGACFMALACAAFGTFFVLKEPQNVQLILLPIIYVYIGGFSIGVGPIPWVLMGEIFPDDIRTTASAIATTVNWLCAFAITLCMTHAVQLVGYSGVMWSFGVCCLVLLVFTVFALPETKNKSFADIQSAFGGVPDSYAPLDNDEDIADQLDRAIAMSDGLTEVVKFPTKPVTKRAEYPPSFVKSVERLSGGASINSLPPRLVSLYWTHVVSQPSPRVGRTWRTLFRAASGRGARVTVKTTLPRRRSLPREQYIEIRAALHQAFGIDPALIDDEECEIVYEEIRQFAAMADEEIRTTKSGVVVIDMVKGDADTTMFVTHLLGIPVKELTIEENRALVALTLLVATVFGGAPDIEYPGWFIQKVKLFSGDPSRFEQIQPQLIRVFWEYHRNDSLRFITLNWEKILRAAASRRVTPKRTEMTNYYPHWFRMDMEDLLGVPWDRVTETAKEEYWGILHADVITDNMKHSDESIIKSEMNDSSHFGDTDPLAQIRRRILAGEFRDVIELLAEAPFEEVPEEVRNAVLRAVGLSGVTKASEETPVDIRELWKRHLESKKGGKSKDTPKKG